MSPETDPTAARLAVTLPRPSCYEHSSGNPDRDDAEIYKWELKQALMNWLAELGVSPWDQTMVLRQTEEIANAQCWW